MKDNSMGMVEATDIIIHGLDQDLDRIIHILHTTIHHIILRIHIIHLTHTILGLTRMTMITDMDINKSVLGILNIIDIKERRSISIGLLFWIL